MPVEKNSMTMPFHWNGR